MSIGDQKIRDRQTQFFPDRLAKYTLARTSWIPRGKKKLWVSSVRETNIWSYFSEQRRDSQAVPDAIWCMGPWEQLESGGRGFFLTLGLKPPLQCLPLCWQLVSFNPFPRVPPPTSALLPKEFEPLELESDILEGINVAKHGGEGSRWKAFWQVRGRAAWWVWEEPELWSQPGFEWRFSVSCCVRRQTVYSVLLLHSSVLCWQTPSFLWLWQGSLTLGKQSPWPSPAVGRCFTNTQSPCLSSTNRTSGRLRSHVQSGDPERWRARIVAGHWETGLCGLKADFWRKLDAGRLLGAEEVSSEKRLREPQCLPSSAVLLARLCPSISARSSRKTDPRPPSRAVVSCRASRGVGP